MKVYACFLLFTIFAITTAENESTENEKGINLNIETVLEFANKDHNSDIKLLDNIKDFITKVKTVIDKKQNTRRNYKEDEVETFTDFILKVIEIVKSYEDTVLQDFFVILDEEIRKYHYRGCKFYELVENSEIRKLTAKKLDIIRGKPVYIIKEYINRLDNFLRDDTHDDYIKELVDYINSLYKRNGKAKFEKVIADLENYSKIKLRRRNNDLTKIIRHGVRSIIFDHYTSLNSNARRDLKERLKLFLHEHKDTTTSESPTIDNDDKNDNNANSIEPDHTEEVLLPNPYIQDEHAGDGNTEAKEREDASKDYQNVNMKDNLKNSYEKYDEKSKEDIKTSYEKQVTNSKEDNFKFNIEKNTKQSKEDDIKSSYENHGENDKQDDLKASYENDGKQSDKDTNSHENDKKQSNTDSNEHSVEKPQFKYMKNKSGTSKQNEPDSEIYNSDEILTPTFEQNSIEFDLEQQRQRNKEPYVTLYPEAITYKLKRSTKLDKLVHRAVKTTTKRTRYQTLWIEESTGRLPKEVLERYKSTQGIIDKPKSEITKKISQKRIPKYAKHKPTIIDDSSQTNKDITIDGTLSNEMDTTTLKFKYLSTEMPKYNKKKTKKQLKDKKLHDTKKQFDVEPIKQLPPITRIIPTKATSEENIYYTKTGELKHEEHSNEIQGVNLEMYDVKKLFAPTKALITQEFAPVTSATTKSTAGSTKFLETTSDAVQSIPTEKLPLRTRPMLGPGPAQPPRVNLVEHLPRKPQTHMDVPRTLATSADLRWLMTVNQYTIQRFENFFGHHNSYRKGVTPLWPNKGLTTKKLTKNKRITTEKRITEQKRGVKYTRSFRKSFNASEDLNKNVILRIAKLEKDLTEIKLKMANSSRYKQYTTRRYDKHDTIDSLNAEGDLKTDSSELPINLGAMAETLVREEDKNRFDMKYLTVKDPNTVQFENNTPTKPTADPETNMQDESSITNKNTDNKIHKIPKVQFEDVPRPILRIYDNFHEPKTVITKTITKGVDETTQFDENTTNNNTAEIIPISTKKPSSNIIVTSPKIDLSNTTANFDDDNLKNSRRITTKSNLNITRINAKEFSNNITEPKAFDKVMNSTNFQNEVTAQKSSRSRKVLQYTTGPLILFDSTVADAKNFLANALNSVQGLNMM